MDFYRFRLPGFERPYTRVVRNKGIVVNIALERKSPAEVDEELKEISELTRSAEIRVLESMQVYLPHPSPRHFLREGKLGEIRDRAASIGANIAIMNVDLSPSQTANIEKFLEMPVVDRAGLILEIFGRRASSKEGKLQVELAQLSYALPRISGLGTVMSRLGGGIGSRGPGEQELEKDRRKIRRRIQQVKLELKRTEKHRHLLRSSREKKGFTSVALVGYTNAGKTTLLNALTGAKALVADKLFATLDPKTRIISKNHHRQFLFVDTVGFIHNLPHTLIDSFHATLEEVAKADMIIHVLDAGDARAKKFKATVEGVLEEIGAAEIPRLLALNKCDSLGETDQDDVQKTWPQGILISAKKRVGLDGLLQELNLASIGLHQDAKSRE